MEPCDGLQEGEELKQHRELRPGLLRLGKVQPPEPGEHQHRDSQRRRVPREGEQRWQRADGFTAQLRSPEAEQEPVDALVGDKRRPPAKRGTDT